MARKPGELVPIGYALSGISGPVKTIHAASPQARQALRELKKIKLV